MCVCVKRAAFINSSFPFRHAPIGTNTIIIIMSVEGKVSIRRKGSIRKCIVSLLETIATVPSPNPQEAKIKFQKREQSEI